MCPCINFCVNFWWPMKEVNKCPQCTLCWSSSVDGLLLRAPPTSPLLSLGQVPPFQRIPSCIGILCSVPRDLVRWRQLITRERRTLVTSTCCDSQRAFNHLEPSAKRNQRRSTISQHFGAFLIRDARGVREISVGCQRQVIRRGMRPTWNNQDSTGWNNNFLSFDCGH